MKSLLLSCASVVAIFAPAAAMAQATAAPQAPASTGSGSNGALADIVVTANKKTQAERLQDVPAAITALNAAQLDNKQFHTLQDLSVSMPNVQLEAAGTQPGTANFSIRGLGSNSTIPTIEPTVGIFIDGVYLSSNWGVLTETFDIDDVEVLRGPQGILFGRNVTGGAVLMHTARPTDQFQVKAVAGVESDPRMYMGLSVGGPLTSTLKAKVSGWYDNDNGYARNITTGRKDGKDQTYQMRGTVVWDPTSNLNFTVVADRTHEAGDGSLTQNFNYTTEPFTTAQGYRTSSHYTVDSVMLESHYNPWDNGGFTMISSYRRLADDATTAGAHAFPVPDSPGEYSTYMKQYSNELRYAGKIAGKADFVTGVYYMHQDIDYFQSDSAFYTRPIQIAHYGGNQALNSYAAFANVDVPVGKFTASLGARVSRDEKSANVASRGVNAASPCIAQGIDCKFDFHGSVHYSNFLPRLTLKYEPVRNFQIFGTVQKGARSGGYNLRSVSFLTPPGPTKDEKVTDFELGFKADLFDRHLRFNTTGFITNIHDIQRSTNILATVNGASIPISITGNAADGRLKGFESEVTWVVGGGFSVDSSAGYIQGKYTKIFSDISGDNIINATDYALKFPRLSPWTYSVGVSYDHELASVGRVHANVNYNHRDANYYDDANKGLLPKQNIINMTLSLEPKALRGAKISAYVKNLTNQVDYGFILPTAAGTIATLEKGRVAGAKIEYKF